MDNILLIIGSFTDYKVFLHLKKSGGVFVYAAILVRCCCTDDLEKWRIRDKEGNTVVIRWRKRDFSCFQTFLDSNRSNYWNCPGISENLLIHLIFKKSTPCRPSIGIEKGAWNSLARKKIIFTLNVWINICLVVSSAIKEALFLIRHSIMSWMFGRLFQFLEMLQMVHDNWYEYYLWFLVEGMIWIWCFVVHQCVRVIRVRLGIRSRGHNALFYIVEADVGILFIRIYSPEYMFSR